MSIALALGTSPALAADPGQDPLPATTALPASGTAPEGILDTLVGAWPSGGPNPMDHARWYRWTAPESGDFLVRVCRDADVAVALRLFGATVPNPTRFADIDDITALHAGVFVFDAKAGCRTGNGSVPVAFRFKATAGTAYFIAAYGYSSLGPYRLALRSGGYNDDWLDATALPAAGTAATGIPGGTDGATGQEGEGSRRDVWFTWTPATSGIATTRICGVTDGGPHELDLLTGAALDTLTKVPSTVGLGTAAGCATPGANDRSRLFQAVAGTTYRLRVSQSLPGVSNQSSFRLYAGFPTAPANDAYAAAIALSAPGTGPTPVWGTTVAATGQAGENANRSVWYRLTPAAGHTVTAVVCDRQLQDSITVRSGSSVSGPNVPHTTESGVAGVCADPGAIGRRITFTGDGTEVHLRVAAPVGTTGQPFALTVTA